MLHHTLPYLQTTSYIFTRFLIHPTYQTLYKLENTLRKGRAVYNFPVPILQLPIDHDTLGTIYLVIRFFYHLG